MLTHRKKQKDEKKAKQVSETEVRPVPKKTVKKTRVKSKAKAKERTRVKEFPTGTMLITSNKPRGYKECRVVSPTEAYALSLQELQQQAKERRLRQLQRLQATSATEAETPPDERPPRPVEAEEVVQQDANLENGEARDGATISVEPEATIPDVGVEEKVDDATAHNHGNSVEREAEAEVDATAPDQPASSDNQTSADTNAVSDIAGESVQMDLSAQPEKYTALTVHYALAAIRARVFDVNTTPCYCRTDVQFMAGNIYRRSPSHYHRSRVLPECEYLPLHCVLHQVTLPTLLESSRHTARLHYGLDPSSCTNDHVQPPPVCRMIAVADSYHYHIMCERANAGSPLAIYQAQQTDLDSPVARTAAYTSTTVPAQCPPKEGRTTRRPRHRSEGSHDSVKTTSQMTPTQGWKEKSSTALRRHQRKMATPPPDTTLQDEGPAPPRGVEPQPIFPNLPCRLPGPRQPAWTPASARDGEPQPIYHKPRLPLHRPKHPGIRDQSPRPLRHDPSYHAVGHPPQQGRHHSRFRVQWASEWATHQLRMWGNGCKPGTWSSTRVRLYPSPGNRHAVGSSISGRGLCTMWMEHSQRITTWYWSRSEWFGEHRCQCRQPRCHRRSRQREPRLVLRTNRATRWQTTTFRALDRLWGVKSRSHPWARFRYKACTRRMRRGFPQSQHCASTLAAGARKVWYFLEYYMMAACGQLGAYILIITALCSTHEAKQTTSFFQWFISGGFQSKSRSGPKSRGDSFQGLPTCGAWLRLLVLSSCIYAATAVVEPRVASSVREAEPGTRLPGPGNVHDLGYDRPVSFTNTQACKRSFRRARMRVQKRISEGKAGETMYRGRLHTAQSLGMRNTCFRSFTEGRRPLHNWSRRPGHMTLRYMTWNCSGLGNMLLPELIQWLDELPPQQRPHVVFLQESHWSITSEWESKGWMHISSGHAEKDKSAGLLTLINIPHVTTKEVRVRRVLQGRLDHIRITHSKGILDILNCYNQAVSFQQPESHYLKRSQLYRNLDKILCSLAVEHQVLVAGDFNLQLRREEPYVGSATCLRAPLDAQIAKDVEQFLEVVRKHALCALNTWRGRRPHTFTHLKYKTQIDYVFTRQSQATGLAKQAMPKHDFIVGAWRDTKHYPVLGTVHVPKPTWQQRTSPKYDITAILQEVQNPGVISQTIQAHMKESLSTLPLDRYDDIPRLLHDLCSRYFLTVPERHPPTPQQVELKQYIKTMWGHYKAAKTGAMMGSPLRGLLRRWRHLVQYHKMRKESQKVGRRLKRERFQTYLEMAEEAANASNTVALYKLVRKLAPKSRRQQVQIRDAEGMIISELDEEEHLRKHFEGVWHPPLQWESPPLCTAAVLPRDESTFSITANEIQQAVCAIRPRKAVSPQLPPAPFWKIAAPALGQWLAGQKGIETADIRYPTSWLMTSVALLQKPGKPVGPLTSLRPIGLQDPLSKAYTSILAQHFNPYALRYLRRIPQYAYLPGRDVMCALMRAVQHCRSVRTTIQGQAYNLHHLRQGTSTTDFRAGLQVSLDLSQAFDTGPWSLVMEAVRRTGAPDGLCSAIAQWIQGTVYELTYKRTRLLVNAGRGVRQGCCLSPIVWSVFTGLLYQEFEAIGGLHSPTKMLSMFADDKHICWELTSPTDLHDALQSLGKLLQLLRKFGLQVNANKSKAILHVQGKGSERIKRTCIELVKDEKHLKVPIREENTMTEELIPLVSQLHYMGIVLSYTSFEEQTMRHRIAVGRANYDRLRKLVNARKILRLHHRIRLWRCAILPAMTYGLLSTGLTKTSADMFAIAWIKQIRAISNSPVHLTGERSLDLLQRVGLPEPLQHLHKLASSSHRLHTQGFASRLTPNSAAASQPAHGL